MNFNLSKKDWEAIGNAMGWKKVAYGEGKDSPANYGDKPTVQSMIDSIEKRMEIVKKNGDRPVMEFLHKLLDALKANNINEAKALIRSHKELMNTVPPEVSSITKEY